MYAIIALVVYPLLEGRMVLDSGTDLSSMLNTLVTGLFPPVAIGVSVLRYRLWDLDRIIRRTLIYTILTLTITVLYFACVVSLQTIFLFFFEPGTGSLAIVLSTLAIAAVIAPLRRRIQHEIDRRFFRQKYNAEQAIARFSATARSEVVVEPLAAALVSTIEETLHPEAVSLWLVSTPGKK
jgi:amino acid transporter